MQLFGWIRKVFWQSAPGLALILPWVGGGLMVLSAGLGVKSWRFVRTQQQAMATVTENVSELAARGGVVYRPRLRFSDGCSLVRVVVAEGSDEPEFAAGQALPVMYRRGYPREAVIATTGRVYFWAILLGVLGIAIFDVALIVQWMLRRQSV